MKFLRVLILAILVITFKYQQNDFPVKNFCAQILNFDLLNFLVLIFYTKARLSIFTDAAVFLQKKIVEIKRNKRLQQCNKELVHFPLVHS